MILWRTISKELQEVRELLNLVQTEFLKLRRKKMIWFMLLTAFIMPFFSFVYFNYLGADDIDPVVFYKLSAFGYTSFIILPFVLGVFCIVLMHDENRYDMLKQLWIVPVSKNGVFFQQVYGCTCLFYYFYVDYSSSIDFIQCFAWICCF